MGGGGQAPHVAGRGGFRRLGVAKCQWSCLHGPAEKGIGHRANLGLGLDQIGRKLEVLECQQIAAKVLGVLRQRIGDARALIRRERAARERRIHVGPQIGVDRVGILMIASRLADQRQLRHGAALGAERPPGNHADQHQGRHQQAVDQQQTAAHRPPG